jgi:hypothetical protein
MIYLIKRLLRSRRKALLLGAGFAAALLAWTVLFQPEQRGAPTVEAAARAYVEALNNRESRQLANLVSDNVEASRAIDEILSRDGGQGIAVVRVDVTEGITPQLASALVEGEKASGLYTEILSLIKHRDRWFAIIESDSASNKPKSNIESSVD